MCLSVAIHALACGDPFLNLGFLAFLAYLSNFLSPLAESNCGVDHLFHISCDILFPSQFLSDAYLASLSFCHFLEYFFP